MEGFKTPVELAKSACLAAKAKVAWSIPQMLLLGVMAGAYIAFGGWLMTVVTHDLAAHMGLGFSKFLGGAIFSVGLMLVVIAGAELFTGNCMMPLGVMAGCIPMSGVVRNWFWVYVANLLGSVIVALLIFYSGLWKGPIGINAFKIAAGKMSLPIGEAIFRGILCNWLVVLAVWMSMAATDIIGKIWAIFFPIMAFVASGYEHSIANMYFMALGILLKGDPTTVSGAGLSQEVLSQVSIGGYFHNLIPVTIGNLVGGILFVAIFYYLVFRTHLEDIV
ncbi:MAG: putative formate transporter 1 [Synergistetes bacterium ADurb.Bin155]|jgi:formate/nitrite transporter|nr:formate/nitrite transporter family protein [Synergistales bacterium]MBP8995415.1 formate/nitrite transporter family protein [Synergistales bacterium]NMD17829.1 formate/nitrite transporter family protein [Synergistaceae bacterium]OQB47063.1 MAG: putative formate transporter 1 [Synergistetes bacterium ADurb.Bin155]HOC82422.1 formate/nitrite transporter family protein [Synergistales bacterium]